MSSFQYTSLERFERGLYHTEFYIFIDYSLEIQFQF